MQYKSELYGSGNEPNLLGTEEEERKLLNVGVVLALTAIALSVAMIVVQNFTGAPRAQNERALGKSQPVVDADVLYAALSIGPSTGRIQK